MKFQNEIQNGMEFLDRHFDDWRSKIVIDDLSMSSCYCCILAQLGQEKNYDYYDMIKILNISSQESIDLGFAVDMSLDNQLDYVNLTDAWVEALWGDKPSGD